VDLAKRGGYPTKILGLYPDSQRGSDWLHKRSNLWVSHRNEAQGRKNWGKKGVARRYRKPEKTPRKTRLPKEELINRAVKLADAMLKLMGVGVHLQTKDIGGGARGLRHRGFWIGILEGGFGFGGARSDMCLKDREGPCG
jgi:hypothetical protein